MSVTLEPAQTDIAEEAEPAAEEIAEVKEAIEPLAEIEEAIREPEAVQPNKRGRPKAAPTEKWQMQQNQ